MGYAGEAETWPQQQGTGKLSGTPGVFVSASSLLALPCDAADVLSLHGRQKRTSPILKCECYGLASSDLWGAARFSIVSMQMKSTVQHVFPDLQQNSAHVRSLTCRYLF